MLSKMTAYLKFLILLGFHMGVFKYIDDSKMGKFYKKNFLFLIVRIKNLRNSQKIAASFFAQMRFYGHVPKFLIGVVQLYKKFMWFFHFCKVESFSAKI